MSKLVGSHAKSAAVLSILAEIRQNRRVVALFGRPGVGKSTVGRELSSVMGCEHLEVDEYTDWRDFIVDVRASGGAVVAESVRVPPGYFDALTREGALLVRVVCDEPVRQGRLRERRGAYSGDHDAAVVEHLTVDTT